MILPFPIQFCIYAAFANMLCDPFNIFSINIPSPTARAFVITCVTAPMRLPFRINASRLGVWSRKDKKFKRIFPFSLLPINIHKLA